MDPTSAPDNPTLDSKSMEERGMIQFRRKPKFPYVSFMHVPGTACKLNVRESYAVGYLSSLDLS